MICPNCGEEIPADSLFCNYCGNKLLHEEGTIENHVQSNSVDDTPAKSGINSRNRMVKLVLGSIFIGLLIFLTIIMQENISRDKILSEFKGYFQTNEYELAQALFQNKIEGDETSVKITGEFFSDEIDALERLYTRKQMNFEEASSKLDEIDKYALIINKAAESRNRLNRLQDAETSGEDKLEEKGEAGKPLLEIVGISKKTDLVFNQCYVQVKNVSERSIEKYELVMLYFDEEGLPAIDATTSANIGKGVSDENLHPGQTSSNKLYYCVPGSAEKIKAIVSRVEFFDGSVWYLSDLDEWIENEKEKF